jgi:ABC-type uncharacterized transport system permease subunit
LRTADGFLQQACCCSHRFAWIQGVSRRRWTLAKVALGGAFVGLAAALAFAFRKVRLVSAAGAR